MNLKLLYQGQKYKIVATYEANTCPIEEFLLSSDPSIQSYLTGFLQMLEHVANNGFQESPASWFHEASKQNSIYEFIKGPYRIFFFKGDADTIAVCTTHIRKSGNKADKASVRYASEKRKEYMSAITQNAVKLIKED